MSDDRLRDRAIDSLEARAGFTTHLTVYVLVNAMLIVIWAFSSSAVFWPIFPMVGWGIAVALHGWSVFARRGPSEDRIRHEMDRLRR